MDIGDAKRVFPDVLHRENMVDFLASIGVAEIKGRAADDFNFRLGEEGVGGESKE